MANFSFTYTPAVIDASGNAWIDPPSVLPNPYFNAGAPAAPPATLSNTPTLPIPSRQNANRGLPHRYTRFLFGQDIRVFLTPDGGGPIAPPDSALGGMLFQAWFAEVPNGMYTWNSVPGQSATQWFSPAVKGAYCAVLSRAGGGGIVWHFMVE
jgi:hypothetical protein